MDDDLWRPSAPASPPAPPPPGIAPVSQSRFGTPVLAPDQGMPGAPPSGPAVSAYGNRSNPWQPVSQAQTWESVPPRRARSGRRTGTVVLRLLLILVIAGVGRALWNTVTNGPTPPPAGTGPSASPAVARSPLAAFKIGQCVLATGYKDPYQSGGSEFHVTIAHIARCGDPAVAKVLATGSMAGIAPTGQAVQAAVHKTVPTKTIGTLVWDSQVWIALAPLNVPTVIGP